MGEKMIPIQPRLLAPDFSFSAAPQNVRYFSTLGPHLSHPLCENPGMKMNTRHQIRTAGGFLGTCRRLLLLAVRRVKGENCARYFQDELPWNLSPGWNGSNHPPVQCPGSLRNSTSGTILSTPNHLPETLKKDFRGAVHQKAEVHGGIPLNHALRVKAAEFWLMLGEVDEALRELDALPKSGRNHPWALKSRIAAMGMVRGGMRSLARGDQSEVPAYQDFLLGFQRRRRGHCGGRQPGRRQNRGLTLHQGDAH
jgi:hypothetical protein